MVDLILHVVTVVGMIPHEVTVGDVVMLVIVVLVVGPTEAHPGMKILMGTGKYLLVKVHLMRPMLEDIMKDAVAMVGLVVVAEVVSAMET